MTSLLLDNASKGMFKIILVSSCLAGVNCKYSGGNNYNKTISELVKKGEAIILCPEMLGNLPVPRIPCEIRKDEKDKRCVVNKEGEDCTKAFMEGAEKTLEVVKARDIKVAILKSRSPSCGAGSVYDGSFSGKLIEGNGVTAQLLIKNGVKVYTEHEISQVQINNLLK